MSPAPQTKPTSLTQMIAFIDALPVAALLVDHSGQLLHCSLSCQRLLGHTDTDWLRDTLGSINLPEGGPFTTYITTPEDQALILHWGSSVSTGYVVLVTDSNAATLLSQDQGQYPTTALADLPDQRQFLSTLVPALTALSHQSDDLCVMCIGLTGLRTINDTLGHRCVDRLLELFVERMLDAGFSNRSMGRLSSGEFVLHTQNSTPIKTPEKIHGVSAQPISEYILDLATRPYIIEETLVSVGCTIGVSSFNNETGTQSIAEPIPSEKVAEELLRQSVVARLGVLQHGQSGTLYFTEEMDEIIKRRRELENDLRRAVALQEFELYFQPKIDLSSSNINGFEALIRWNHPTRGLVPPFEFIPAAESLGLIIPIGEWVIQEACRCAANWPEGTSVAINLSPIQFAQDNLCDIVQQALDTSGISASQVELEITESVLLGDGSAPTEVDIVDVLTRLKKTGIHISIDDFGTGYSSLSYLAKFPFDTLKIDQSFVRDEENEESNALIRAAIVALGKKFGMSIVAEGIETEHQLQVLADEHCDVGQGYLFSKPVPFSETFGLLNQFNGLHLSAFASDNAPVGEPEVTATPGSELETPNEEELLRLVYLSTNLIEHDTEALEREISQIMSSCINNNAQAGVSGALMFNHSVFAQVMEGPPRKVEQTFERIQRDNRHANVVVLDCRRTVKRSFPNWAMAFISESDENETAFREIATLTDFNDKPLQGDKILQALLGLVYEKSADGNGIDFNQQAA